MLDEGEKLRYIRGHRKEENEGSKVWICVYIYLYFGIKCAFLKVLKEDMGRLANRKVKLKNRVIYFRC